MASLRRIWLIPLAFVFDGCGLPAPDPIQTDTDDRRLEKQIEPLAGSLERLLRLRGVTYHWREPKKEGGEGPQVGFSAQEVEEVFPEWVGSRSDGMMTLSVSTTTLGALTVEAFRELKLRSGTLAAENTALRERVASLLRRRPAARRG